MAREVSPDDFTDDYLQGLFDDVSRLVWTSADKVPAWIEQEAEDFSRNPPRATPAEMRDHLQHAIFVARGWDDPDDRRTILHSALKAYYLIQWIGRLAHHQRNKTLDLSHAYKVSFAPTFKDATSIDIAPANRPDPGA